MTLINEFFDNYKMSKEDLVTAFFEARNGAVGTKEDFDTPVKPTCSNPDTGFSKSFTTIRQAAEWVIDDDDGNVPHPFGTVKASKYSSYPWASLPKHVQNSIMNNILNAACKKETRADLEDRYRDSGYGLVWELDDPSEIINDDIRCSYDEGHGSVENRATLKAKYAAEKTEKAEKVKQEKIDFINKNKDWAISKLNRKLKTGETLFEYFNCESNYGYPEWGISGYFSNNFDKYIEHIQKELDEKAAAKGKKAKSLVKYFQYLDEVAKDLGISVEDNDENN